MLWNEPNNLSHWDRSLDPEWALFGEMVGLAGERIGQVAPNITRVLGGISPIDPRFVRKLLAQGIGDALDVIAVHGFPLDWNRWHLSEWPRRIASIRDICPDKPIWATEVGASSFVSPALQEWALDATLGTLTEHADRVFWYALMDLPERWEAVTRHRGSEGTAYYRHFRMGVCDADGQPKPAAGALARWAGAGVGVCEWVYWNERTRFEQMISLLSELGIRRVRTGLGWADWDRPGAIDWFDYVMARLAPFEVTLTLCFTPARAGRQPHHTSPPQRLADYADFCEAVVGRYASATLSPVVAQT